VNSTLPLFEFTNEQRADWQLRALAVMSDQIVNGREAGLPILAWTLDRGPSITGRVHHLDTHEVQRDTFAAWARVIGIGESHEQQRPGGAVRLSGRVELIDGLVNVNLVADLLPARAKAEQ
jgi:hypothetical protein